MNIITFLVLLYIIQFILVYTFTVRLKRGKYLVIGNCSSCYPANAHDIVQKFDGTVITFNNNQTFSADLMVFGDMFMIERTLGLTNHNTKLTDTPILVNQNQFSLLWFHSFMNIILFAIHKKKIAFVNTQNTLFRGNVLSTGTSLIRRLLQDNNTVYYFGFDHKDTSQTADARFYHLHDFAHEAQLLQDWERSGKLVRIK